MTNMNSLWMQNFNNIMMKNMDIFNLSITNLVIFLSIFLSILIFFSLMNKNSMSFSNESNELELFWTIIPSFIILIISLPSMFLLYCYEENKFSFMDVKVMGNQWYWTYEYPSMYLVDSYIKSSLFLRCINTSNSLVIPSNKFIRLLLSSNDVLHSWTLPSLMMKMDAVPGRLNMMFLNCNKSILLKGQCSEICGINHSFMPISVLSLNLNKI
uniref:Cytochrome c oxidase subunit 2 n=1 Tax=Tetranychus truncatus TaxID=93132 RepID=A0A0U1XDF0_9ACAR|nr:cytochrome c oxidase subunit II [Tetranychus truncatus]AIM52000.1 cytochrome c oxidase subunit II [Tetranychus truncatus]AUT13512.1 cytochrome c oxidase subunit II [Tetranychus truncatus]AUT13525.1 cytochrome c oxidase subunit II [Tetranychus truncatus]AUT13538.1 cytochrome c oxidase subunit II [Tetranychus truncatus]AUT13551.1 cytochrome c oxidase subunit II [Tetranychus truncatus]